MSAGEANATKVSAAAIAWRRSFMPPIPPHAVALWLAPLRLRPTRRSGRRIVQHRGLAQIIVVGDNCRGERGGMPGMSKSYETILIEKEDGMTWVIFNRPEKRNAMSPQMHFEMDEALSTLAHDSATKVLILTGAGASFSAGQDLKLYFREMADNPEGRAKAQHASNQWRWHRLTAFPKPTIAMVNGHCFRG